MQDAVGPALVHGELRFRQFRPGRIQTGPPNWSPNSTTTDWGAILARLMSGDIKYRIAFMYLEFENGAIVGEVDPPSFDRSDPSEAIAYYESLIVSSNRDFLRVPVLFRDVDSADEDVYPNGNRALFSARTTENAGIGGKAFNDSAGSVLYGGALVAAPVPDDRTQDLILCRGYVSSKGQLEKMEASQITLDWRFRFN